jgi:DNA-binding transcriptional ArsR family regulator
MDAFLALADPTRRNILELLGAGPKSAGEIASRFPVSAPAISQHFKILREARLVQVRVDAQRRIYCIDPAGLRDVDRWLAQYRRFWTARLDALESRLRAEAASSSESQTTAKPSRRKGNIR